MPPPPMTQPSRRVGNDSPKEATPLDPVGSILLEGERAFGSDLPELLKAHAGRWVAYLGPRRLDVADSSAELYQRYASQGIDPKALFVELIHPEAASDAFSFTCPRGR